VCKSIANAAMSVGDGIAAVVVSTGIGSREVGNLLVFTPFINELIRSTVDFEHRDFRTP